MIETIGIVGGGQLGRMLTEAATPLGYAVEVIDPVSKCPAAQVGARVLRAELTDTQAIQQLADRSGVLTWEIEHIPAHFLQGLDEQGYDIQPSPSTLAIIQDKLRQKQFLRANGIPVAPFAEVLDKKVLRSGGPYVVKSRRGGYDGRGSLSMDRLDKTVIGNFFGKQAVYIERKLAFQKELSVVAARDLRGNVAMYPVVETIHEDNICKLVLAPAHIEPTILRQVTATAHKTMRCLKGAGVFAIEMFVVDDKVVVNEIAPRVHNSGHHTIEACETSQFEQHIRAITGMPLGSTVMRAPAAAMINILGRRKEPLLRKGLDGVLALPDTHPHFYGKDPRPGRKVGHITVLGASVSQARERAELARSKLSI
ncbi:MAG TPA: 5-(carboxyamino)imidazole ribonucleotide synthase [Candidatus Saccharimonadales bacterium]|nr:5-(carboxyamino)imidazole ribonucleotide synthase [Candidatus Saccharimonadales bacterium]